MIDFFLLLMTYDRPTDRRLSHRQPKQSQVKLSRTVQSQAKPGEGKTSAQRHSHDFLAPRMFLVI